MLGCLASIDFTHGHLGDRAREGYRELLTWPQVKVLNAILRGRAGALGGHRDQCTRGGYQAISYNFGPKSPLSAMPDQRA